MSPAPLAEVPKPTPPLEDPDLLFHVFTFLPAAQRGGGPAVHNSLHSVLLTSHAWRVVALRPDLPHWTRCDRAMFEALAPLDDCCSALTDRIKQLVAWAALSDAPQWSCESVERLLRAKSQLRALDLSHCFVRDAQAVARLALRLPPTLHTLSLQHGCNQPDAMLHQLLRGLSALPRLRCLDLRGILDERTLAGLRVLGRKEGKTATSMAVSLPALEALSVGFHLHSALGAREGAQFLTAQVALAPRLKTVGCRVAAEAAWGGLGPVDIVCRCCGGRLYEQLEAYVVHPPQQPHISYEIHTDEPPRVAALVADGADGSRLWCARSCQGQLWLVDHGSGLVRHVLGCKYAIACGPPVGEGPALAMAIPAGAARPTTPVEGTAESGGAGGAGTPPDPELDAFPSSLWTV